MKIQIVCINKDNGNHHNPHESINRFGWIDQDNTEKHSTLEQMVTFLMDKKNSAYVSDGQNLAYCYVNTSASGRRFIQTHRDNMWSNNLLQLREC